jgi:hypothetical protein
MARALHLEFLAEAGADLRLCTEFPKAVGLLAFNVLFMVHDFL